MSSSIKSDCDSESLKQENEISCVICFDDLTDENIVSYKRYGDANYIKSDCCNNCVKHLIETSWNNYMNSIKKADCEAEMKRLIEHGPPVNLRCMSFLTVDINGEKIKPDEEFESLYFDNQIQSAKLKGSLEFGSNERNLWMHEQQQVLEYLKTNPSKNEEISSPMSKTV